MPLLVHVTTADISLELLLGPQLRAFQRAGYEVVGMSAPGPFAERLVADGIAHVPLQHATRGSALGSDARLLRELYARFRELRPDIVHTHNPKPGVLGRLAARAAGVPVIVNTQHGLYATRDDGFARRGVVYGLERVAAACSHAELVQNPEDVETLARLGVPRRRLTVLGNGIDLARFSRDAIDAAAAAALRASVVDGPDEVVACVVSRLVWEKGYAELRDAARALAAANSAGSAAVPVRFVVAGPIETEKADALGAADIAELEALGVRFLGMRDDVETVYAAADLNVLASHREGWPRSPMEASAFGIPTVVTDIRGGRQVVEDGVTGLLVPVRDGAALAAAVGRLASDGDLRRRMGAAALRKARAEFDQQRVIDVTLSTYSSLLGALGPGHGSERAQERLGYRLKRLIDVVGAVAGLVVLSPVIAVVALLVRLRLGSPVLFRQLRPGLHGVPFEILKFRTMTDRRGPDGELLPDKDRMTALGRLLRRLSLDELPELVNVLRGEMSLVGPRPLLMEYLPRYTAEQKRRHDVRPGITGWTQVNGRNDLSWDEKFALDVWYVDNASLAVDVRILLATVKHVLTGSGVAQAGHVTMPRYDEQG